MKNLSVYESDLLNEKYDRFMHESGLEVVVFPKKLSTYYASFGTRYGSVDNCFKLEGEEEFTTVPDGIAHYLEHKMFEQEDGVDAFERYAQTGASANAFTSNKRTVYLFSCTEQFDESLEILLDFVTSPYFTPETVQKEQGIIGQEIKMYEDNPGWTGYQTLMECMYKNNGVKIDIAGTCESIAQITADILYKCYNTFYSLSNMTLSVCGDVTPEQVAAVCDKVLKPCEEKKIIRFSEEEPAEVVTERVVKQRSVAKSLFYIGVKDTDISAIPAERTKKKAAMNILNDIMFSHSGEFFNTLFAEGLINPQFGYEYEHNSSYSFNLFAGESDNPDEVLSRIQAYVEKTKETGLDAEDFERCKRGVYAAAVRGFDDAGTISNTMIDCLFEEEDIFALPEIVSKITLEDVTALLHSVYAPGRYAMCIVEPV